jgi:U6 snRNA-associated Sm-like protein LSm7
MDFSPYINKKVIVNFSGGREISGVLKGFDQVSNLVLVDVVESIKDKDSQKEIRKRQLGLIIVRGPNVLFYNSRSVHSSQQRILLKLVIPSLN